MGFSVNSSFKMTRTKASRFAELYDTSKRVEQLTSGVIVAVGGELTNNGCVAIEMPCTVVCDDKRITECMADMFSVADDFTVASAGSRIRVTFGVREEN